MTVQKFTISIKKVYNCKDKSLSLHFYYASKFLGACIVPILGHSNCYEIGIQNCRDSHYGNEVFFKNVSSILNLFIKDMKKEITTLGITFEFIFDNQNKIDVFTSADISENDEITFPLELPGTMYQQFIFSQDEMMVISELLFPVFSTST